MTIDPTTKARALKLLERGAATSAEVAFALDVSRQAIQQWCDKAGIDPVKARATYVRKLLKVKP